MADTPPDDLIDVSPPADLIDVPSAGGGRPPPDLKEDLGEHPWVTRAADAVRAFVESLPAGSAAEPGFGGLKTMARPVLDVANRFGMGGVPALFTGRGMTLKPRAETVDTALMALPGAAKAARAAPEAIGGAMSAAGRGGRAVADAAATAGRAIKPTTSADVNRALEALKAGGSDVLSAAGSPRVTALESETAARATERMDRTIAGVERSDIPRRQFDAAQAVRAHETAVEQQRPRIVEKHIGPPKTADEIGEPMKARIMANRDAEMKARSGAANVAYASARDAGMAEEAAGRGFATSDAGKALLSDLRKSLKSVSGHDQLADDKRAKINELISTIVGGPRGTGMQAEMNALAEEGGKKLPAGIAKLMDEYRDLRNFKPGEAPARGRQAVDKTFATELANKLEKALGEWSPRWKDANEAYKKASDELRKFETRTVGGALAGQPYDYYDPAAAAAEYPGRFFKNRQTVQELRATLGSNDAVREAASQYASAQLSTKTSIDAAQAWARDNRAWIDEAGIGAKVRGYLDDLKKFEAEAKTTGERLAAQSKRVAGLRQGERDQLAAAQTGRSESEKAITNREADRAALVADISRMFGATSSKDVIAQWRSIAPKAEAAGALTAEQRAQLDARIEDLSRMTDKAERNRRIGRAIAALTGLRIIGHLPPAP